MKKNYTDKKIAFLLATAACVLLTLAAAGAIGFCFARRDADEAANYRLRRQLLTDVSGSEASLTDYYIYGNHLHLEGSIDIGDADRVSMILRGSDGKEKELPLFITAEKGKLRFTSSETINTGLCLDDLAPDSYCVLFRVIRGGRDYRICSKKPAGFETLSYYTVTKNSENRLVKISCEKFFNRGTLMPCLAIKVSRVNLPADVCDIVIDAGHGGLDSGAACFGHTEAEITVVYAKALKTSLEKAGLRVALTRDGTEPAELMTPAAAYFKGGRVDRACSSGAKYCLALHLNSSGDGSPAKSGGVQVYCANGDELSFASSLAKAIVKHAGTSFSSQTFCRKKPGVYVRTFSAADVAASRKRLKAAGIEPYETLSQKTTYYYIVRELGGIAAGAYIDGRVASSGKNSHYDSRIGIESYLVELGYINCETDLNNILKNRSGYIEGITEAVKAELGL